GRSRKSIRDDSARRGIPPRTGLELEKRHGRAWVGRYIVQGVVEEQRVVLKRALVRLRILFPDHTGLFEAGDRIGETIDAYINFSEALERSGIPLAPRVCQLAYGLLEQFHCGCVVAEQRMGVCKTHQQGGKIGRAAAQLALANLQRMLVI